jgi:uncharacterized alpha/beta hydrolase family protein
MNVVDRVKQHQELQRKYPKLSPDDIELMIINGTLQPEPKTKSQGMTWADGLSMLFLIAIVIFVGILLK